MKAMLFKIVLLLLLSLQAYAADIRDQLNVQTGKAELVIPGMTPQEVATKVKDAISQWSIPANLNFRTLPSEIPVRPDEPVAKQIYFQGAPAIEYQCGTAFAEITKNPPPVKNVFYYNQEFLQACVYPFQKGVKVYLIFTIARKTESLTAGVFNGITKAIRGNDGDRITGQLNENIDSIKKKIPSLLVEKLEAPEMPIQEPDKGAVAALIPAKATMVQPSIQPVQMNATAQTFAPPAPAHSPQAKIEARKNLTAMGMTYHSQEQFISAIKRKDDVAIQLFLDGEGIDLNAKDSNGKTPLEIAQNVGAPDIARMILERITKPTTRSTPQNSTGLTPAPAPSDSNSLEAAKASIPPELLAQINAKIDALNLPAEQKEAMRANAIRQVSQMRAAANQIPQGD